MTEIGRTWKLWASRHANDKLWNVGARRFVELHGTSHPIVPVLTEEILGDPYQSEVTHYGWQHVEGSRYRHSDVPVMIQVRTGTEPRRSMMFLDMCFPYGVAAEVEAGRGSVLALRITERSEDP